VSTRCQKPIILTRIIAADEGSKPGEIYDIPDIDGHTNELTKDMNALSVEADTPDIDDIPDMEEEGLEEVADEATAKPAPAAPVEVAKGNLLQVRTYDVMITYDKYYQTPRIWLLGFDEVCCSLCNSFIGLNPLS
jgi:ubiquitin-like-conjugating enzyme ATG3